VCLLGLCTLSTGPARAADLDLPAALATHPDGRMPIQQLYGEYLSLLEHGWRLDIVARSQPPGREHALPIIALRTPQAGEAAWILSGIHGEETAGPNAIAASIDVLAELGRRRPVVLLPLNNPQGYAHNWRYLNTATWSPEVDGQSVGDSSHLLPDPARPGSARAAAASSPEAAAITAYILKLAEQYPPAWSIDLHEDNLISEGYVYSQGRLGAADPLAALAVRALRDNGIPLKMSGETRFGETIADGIIGPVVDSSVDELMSAATIVLDGQMKPGPNAYTVLVFETPAAQVGLQRRVVAHAALLKALAEEIAAAPAQ
jgi:Succinylglutamate desuccinylase / Aspartoacylase family